jgi:hypothetical protein
MISIIVGATIMLVGIIIGYALGVAKFSKNDA